MKRIAATFAILLIGVLLYPLLQSVVWDGGFNLAIVCDVSPDVDLSSLQYAECWREQDQDWLRSIARDSHSDAFENLRVDEYGQHVAYLPCSGRSDVLGILETYTEPQSVLLRYRRHDNNEWSLLIIDIPEGRGNRHVQAVLE